MASFRTSLIALCLLLAGIVAHAQQSAGPPQAPTVVFKFHWDKGLPWLDYAFTVNENGTTHFAGTVNPAENGSGDSVEQDFTMSPAALQEILRVAKATDYFQGELEIRQKNVAKTGSKTLEYHSPSLTTSATYNFSPNPDIQQLTKLFIAIATTIDYGRKLTFQYRFDKLGIDSRLKELVDLHASGMAEEIQIIEPILRKIADDDGMMHLARSQAKQLLKASATPVSASQTGSSQR